MNNWPEDPSEPAYFSDILDPLVKLIKQAYTFRRTRKQKLTYDGLPLGHKEAVCNFDLPEHYSDPSLIAYHRERGLNLLSQILMTAIHLGMEQGRRMEKRDDLKRARVQFALTALKEGDKDTAIRSLESYLGR